MQKQGFKTLKQKIRFRESKGFIVFLENMKSQKFFYIRNFLKIFLLEHLIIQIGRKILLNTLWSTNDHKLNNFKMPENLQMQTVQYSYGWEIPCIYFAQLPNFSTNPTCQFQNIENMGFYQYYPIWSPSHTNEQKKDLHFAKADESHVAQQTSTGSKSLQIFQKPKRNQAPRFRPTKNNESNICNQAFSFMTNASKSKNILENMYKSTAKTQIFYDYAKYLSSKRKKYMSKGTLLKLCILTEASEEIHQVIKLRKFNILTLKQFQSGVCFLILYFLKHKSTSSILTSQKIASNLKKDHINKVREILCFVQQSLEKEKQNVRHSTQMEKEQ